MARTRFSPQRSLILEYVKQSTDHPTAEEIYQALKDRFPGLSRGTVYRNLTFFQEHGLVRSVGVINGQERFDGNISHHPHFICNCCGSVIDLFMLPYNHKPQVEQGLLEEECSKALSDFFKELRGRRKSNKSSISLDA